MLYAVLYMAATRTQIYLTAEQRRRLDAVRARNGQSLAGAVREAVDRYLADTDDGEDPAAAMAETFGAAPEFSAPSRDEWAQRERRNA